MSKNTQLGNLVNGIYVDASGNVGIGTSAPSSKLHLVGTLRINNPSVSGQYMELYTSSGISYYNSQNNSAFYTAFQHIFNTDGASPAERMRITSAGTVYINATSGGYSTPRLYVDNGATTSVGFVVVSDNGGRLARFNNRDYNDTNTGSSVRLGFGAGTGNTFATINSYQSGESAVNTLVLNQSGGDVYVGTTTSQMSTAGRGLLAVNGTSTTAVHFMIGGADKGFLYHNGGDFYWKANGAGNYLYAVAVTNGVYLSTNATSWTANSDERLKDINSQITDAVTSVNSLRAVKYSWKADKEKEQQVGLIAQDVQKVLPEAVTVKNDEMGTLGVKYTEVIPLLVAAIQELSAEINILKQK